MIVRPRARLRRRPASRWPSRVDLARLALAGIREASLDAAEERCLLRWAYPAVAAATGIPGPRLRRYAGGGPRPRGMPAEYATADFRIRYRPRRSLAD